MTDADETGAESAADRGSRAIDALRRAGQRLGYRVETEYPVQGGRLDVVWLTDLPDVFDTDSLVIAAFEIESSWRTRKHLKGDYLNLFDVGAAIGVLVLLGDGADVESTRTFSSVLVQRPGPRVLVWSDDDIDRLTDSVAVIADDVEQRSARDIAVAAPPTGDDIPRHVGKYRSLWQWLTSQTASELSLTFGEIEEVIGTPLPPSCRRHPAHWYSHEGSAVARAIRDAGWHASNLSIPNERITLRQTRPPEPA